MAHDLDEITWNDPFSFQLKNNLYMDERGWFLRQKNLESARIGHFGPERAAE